jgi:hypothetical protein
MSLGGGDVKEDEYSHKDIDRSAQINTVYIKSNEYRRKFDNATQSPKVNKTLYDIAKNLLISRNGTRYESMYWIDGETGKIIAEFDIMGRVPELTGKDHELKVEYPDSVLHKLKGHDNVVVIHNHPNSSAPSVGDFNSAYKHGYSLGFVTAHNGDLYKYSAKTDITDLIYDQYWKSFLNDHFDFLTAQKKAIEKIAQNGLITFEEVMNK